MEEFHAPTYSLSRACCRSLLGLAGALAALLGGRGACGATVGSRSNGGVGSERATSGGYATAQMDRQVGVCRGQRTAETMSVQLIRRVITEATTRRLHEVATGPAIESAALRHTLADHQNC